MLKILQILLAFLILTPLSYSQRSKSPTAENKVRSYVTDKTGTLSSQQIQTLETKLSNFEKETSNQVVVWMTPTLDGESLEEKSFEIAEQNGIGQKDKNNGVLLFIAKNDRKLRIEVGYGLEGALTDALCSQIIRKEITPYFKQGNFYSGINAGVDAIIKATKGEYKQDKNFDNEESRDMCWGFSIVVLIVLFMVFFFVVIPLLSRIFGRGKKGGSNWWYTGGSGSSWSSGSSDSSWSGGGFSGGGGSFGGGGSSGSW